MLSKLVVKLYSVLLEIGLWFILIISFAAGWRAAGVLGAIGGVLIGAVIGAVIFGALLVLDDIRKKVNAIESRETKV